MADKPSDSKKMGRPLVEISTEIFEELCRIQCTLSEVASVFRCSEDTVERWCKRTFQQTFADAHKRYSEDGKTSLRRAQFKSALNGNATMQIWLGKQHLNQHDKIIVNITPDVADQMINQSGAPLPETFHGEPLHSDEK